LSGGTAVGATFEISNLDVANNAQVGTPAQLVQGPHSVESTFVASDVIAPNTPNPGIEADFYNAAAKASVYSEPVVTDDSNTIAEVDISTLQGAMDAVQVIKDAIYMVDSYRNELGAVSNRLDHTVQNLYTRIENQMAAYSRIEDADYAVESAQLARMQVLQQAGTAMLAQANASSIGVLALLK
jgi:flagellin-like hook-associated protein FlgL